MAVKIRLARRGRKKLAIYDVVVADARSPRDGRFIEKLGTFNPNTHPATVNIDNDKALQWILNGAQPTDSARAILSQNGIMLRKHLQIGVNKGAITQEEADKRFAQWQLDKDRKNQANLTEVEKRKAAEQKARLEAEKKVNEAKAAELQKRQAALVEESEEEVEATVPDQVEESDEVAVKEVEVSDEEAPAEESKVEEPKAEETEVVDETEAEVKVAAEETPAEEVIEEEPANEVTEVKSESDEAPVAEAKEEPVSEEVTEEKPAEEEKEESSEEEEDKK